MRHTFQWEPGKSNLLYSRSSRHAQRKNNGGSDPGLLLGELAAFTLGSRWGWALSLARTRTLIRNLALSLWWVWLVGSVSLQKVLSTRGVERGQNILGHTLADTHIHGSSSFVKWWCKNHLMQRHIVNKTKLGKSGGVGPNSASLVLWQNHMYFKCSIGTFRFRFGLEEATEACC